jgi:hypothetical protein
VFNNTNAVIEFNQILQNGSDMGPGGIALYTGQYGYKVCNNHIIGNFTMAAGAGIGHDGCSPGGLIANNVIAYNECFKGVVGPGVPVSGEGGGIYIAGELLTAPAGTTVVGAGSVTIINNLIQGNLAGSGDGGGIRVAAFNGQDVAASNNPSPSPAPWSMTPRSFSQMNPQATSIRKTARSSSPSFSISPKPTAAPWPW